ncbi:hypothetical protein MMC21_003843 [Puttea exsequens]|nr:hypothetical protein [Puttea exsequens]
MAAKLLTTLFALVAAAAASPLERRTTATCNIDQVEFQSVAASHACSLIPSHFTVTPPVTVLATYNGTYVSLAQKQANWSGSSSVAVTLCNQIIHDCGGTVGVAEQYGADISTGGAFGDPTGIIEVTGYNVYP